MKLGEFEVNNIYCGDSAELLKGLPDGCVDLCLTSPPYDDMDMEFNPIPAKGMRKYNGYTWDFKAIAQGLYRALKPGGILVWVVNDPTPNGSESLASCLQKIYFRQLGFNVHDTMFYRTQKAPLSHNRYEQEIEYMFVFSKGRPKTVNLLREKSIYFGIDKRRNGYYTHNGHYLEDKRVRNGKKRQPPNPTKVKGHCWEFKTGAGHSGDSIAFQHPATFPEALAESHILSWSDPGDIVLDPFCGSGTTCKVAAELGRLYLGFELSSKYVELSRKRLSSITQVFPLLQAVL